MTWTAILLMAVVAYALKALGPVVLGARVVPPATRALLDLAPVPLLAALICVQTIATDDRFTLDARLPALAVAALLVWRRAPFLVVIVAAATAALLRALCGAADGQSHRTYRPVRVFGQWTRRRSSPDPDSWSRPAARRSR